MKTDTSLSPFNRVQIKANSMSAITFAATSRLSAELTSTTASSLKDPRELTSTYSMP